MPSATPRRTSATHSSIPALPARDAARRSRHEGLAARCPRRPVGRGRARPRLPHRRRARPARGSRRPSASSRRFPARPAARVRSAARPRRAPPRARAGPRPTGSRCGSAGRRRSALAHGAEPTPRTPRRRRDRSAARARPARARPRSGTGAPARARACGRARVPRARYRAAARSSLARTSISSEPYVPSVSFGSFARNRKIASRPSYVPAMTPRPGTDQTASSAKSPRSASPSFRANASKIRADDRRVLSCGHGPPPSARSRPSTWRRWASVNGASATSRRTSSGSSFAIAASRCSRCGVGWRSCRRSQRSRLTAA